MAKEKKIINQDMTFGEALENDQNLACHLYQDLDDAVNIIGLDSSGDIFLRDLDNKIKSLYSIKCGISKFNRKGTNKAF